MAITLDPPINTLGITAPYVGRWFSKSVTLPALTAGGDLGLALTLPPGTNWLPPAAGLFSLYVAEDGVRPTVLRRLRNAAGQYPFAAGTVVAYFRLLPEVAARLHYLTRHLPRLTADAASEPDLSASGPPRRPRVESFALVMPSAVNSLAAIKSLIPDFPQIDDDEAAAQYLGLQLSGAALRSPEEDVLPPMTQLRRPGTYQLPEDLGSPQQDVILKDLGTSATLWAFDSRGRALDPGAVAAWFSYLAVKVVSDTQLVAPPGETNQWPTVGGSPVVCEFATTNGRTVHLVDAHEGPLDEPFVKSSGARLLLADSGVTQTLLVAGSDPIALKFSSVPPDPTPKPYNPPLDTAPEPRMALLPEGTFGNTLTLWPNGVSDGLARDFGRVAVVDVERHLVGVARAVSDLGSGDPNSHSEAERRGPDQNRPSTRVPVARCTVQNNEPVLLTTMDETVGRVIDLFKEGTAATRMVAGMADSRAGALSPSLLAITNPSLPASLKQVSGQSSQLSDDGDFVVRALAGCGTVDSGNYRDQQVLVELKLATGMSGAWVRAWSLGFDVGISEHVRLNGGAGRVGADGHVRLVMLLPDSDSDAVASSGFDLMVAFLDANGRLRTRTYGDNRYDRPAPVTGDLADPTAFTSSTKWCVCESGQSGTGTIGADAVPSGATVVVEAAQDSYTLAVRSKVPLQPDVMLGSVVSANDVIALTQPAYRACVDRVDDRGVPRPSDSTSGDANGGLAAVTGAIVERMTRTTRPSDVLLSSRPFATSDRLELVAARVESNDAVAVVGGGSLLPNAHELPPHYAGHPGAPAAAETHATGARLKGPAALLAAEYVRDRTAGLGTTTAAELKDTLLGLWNLSEAALAVDAHNANEPTLSASGPGPMVALLRTTAVGMEGLPGVGVAATQKVNNTTPYPLSEAADRVEKWLDNLAASLKMPSLRTQVMNAINGVASPKVLRALDRRLKMAIDGGREAFFALTNIFSKAQDLVYIETAAFDSLLVGAGANDSGTNPITSALIKRLTDVPGLHAVICVSAEIAPGYPRGLAEVRNAELLKTMRLVSAAGKKRVAFLCPGAGAGRSVRLASTSVIVDDVFALTGTTHLWRRGLTFDSSLAVSLFDERLTDGRPTEVRRFRRALLAERLGISANLVPESPTELVEAVNALRGAGSFRTAMREIVAPDKVFPETPDYPTTADRNVWDPDGTNPSFDFDDLGRFFAGAKRSPAGDINDPSQN